MMTRLLSACLFVAITCAASDCSAQLFKRHSRVQPTPIAQRSHVQHNKIELGRYSTYRNQTISRILDGPTSRYRSPAEVNSRYIGGFHQSHFNNIGIPNGDIGIRGNAYNWRTW